MTDIILSCISLLLRLPTAVIIFDELFRRFISTIKKPRK